MQGLIQHVQVYFTSIPLYVQSGPVGIVLQNFCIWTGLPNGVGSNHSIDFSLLLELNMPFFIDLKPYSYISGIYWSENGTSGELWF